jgi:DNA-binding NarL/FixJ family response regulator
LLVDDHAMVRAGLRMLIESRGGYQVVGEAGGPGDAVMLAKSTHPDMILLDLDLGSGPTLDLIEELRAVDARNHPQVVILTGLRDAGVHRRAVRLGARGVVSKETAAESLLTAIEKVAAGELWLDRVQLGRLASEMSGAEPDGIQSERVRIDKLTPREREVVLLVGQGLKNREIAKRLAISETTVRHHLTSVFAKLEVTDRLSLLLFALKHRLACPSS